MTGNGAYRRDAAQLSDDLEPTLQVAIDGWRALDELPISSGIKLRCHKISRTQKIPQNRSCCKVSIANLPWSITFKEVRHSQGGLYLCSCLKQCLGSYDRLIQRFHHIFFADLLEESCLMHQEIRLGMRAAQDQVLSVFAQLAVQVFQHMQRAAIHADDLVHFQYQHFRHFVRLLQYGFQLVCRTEEQSPNTRQIITPGSTLLRNMRVLLMKKIWSDSQPELRTVQQITNDLVAVFWQPSRMARSFIRE